jgi:hypothetical protein
MKDVPSPRSRGKSAPMSRDVAESLAIEGLSFLAAERARIERFLALSGLDPDTLRAAAASPDFLVAVLDHLAGEEDLLLAFATNRGLDPETIATARRVLSPDEEAS